jgi:hypothetical protein
MIMDILTNPDLMRKENIAEGYDIFTGDVDENHPSNQKYILVMSGFQHVTVTVEPLQMTCLLVLLFLEISLIHTYTVL